MKSCFLFMFLILSFNLYALVVRSGDVLLISFNCYECKVIESETNSFFSHSGIVIRDEKNRLMIGQSLGSVALYSLEEFTKNKTPGTNISVYRPKDFIAMTDLDFQNLEKNMLEIFNLRFKGLLFDSKYIWNNVDDKGRELLYCSEFIAKFLDHFLKSPTIPYPLTYTKNYDYWFKYFNGDIPEGELGNSPASFSRDDRFILIGTI